MAWGIVPKIREVDLFLRQNPDVPSKIREVHPEVCFCAFNAALPMSFPKHTPEGYEERKKVLQRFEGLHRGHGRVDAILGATRQLPRGAVEGNDVLDALVAAFTAEPAADQPLSIPAEPEWDGALRMEMVYRLVPIGV